MRAECIGAADVALWVVADHVYGLDLAAGTKAPVEVFVPGVEDLLAIRIRGLGRLTNDRILELGLALCSVSPDTAEAFAEGALGEARMIVLGGPLEVGITEVQLGLIVLEISVVGQVDGVVAHRLLAKLSAAGQEKVADHLQVEAPITRRRPDEDSSDLDTLGVLHGTTMLGMMVPGELRKRVDVLPLSHQIRRRDDFLESIRVSEIANVVTVAAQDENRLVLVLGHEVMEGRVRLNKLLLVEVEVQPQRKPGDMILLGETPSVRQEDERDVVLLQHLDCLAGARNGLIPSHQDAIDVEGEGNGFRLWSIAVQGIKEPLILEVESGASDCSCIVRPGRGRTVEVCRW